MFFFNNGNSERLYKNYKTAILIDDRNVVFNILHFFNVFSRNTFQASVNFNHSNKLSAEACGVTDKTETKI